jgi:hypothetical protein
MIKLLLIGSFVLGLSGATTAPAAPLTPAQQATKSAVCVSFNSNAVMPLGVPLANVAADCPLVSV